MVSIFASDEVKEFEYMGYKFGIREIPYGELVQINKKAMSINFVTKQPEIDIAVLQEEKIKASLAYIKDPQGNDIPVNIDTVRKLKGEVAELLLEEIDKLNDVSEEEKKS